MKIKICHISDTHTKHDQLIVPECDILIHSGDISSTGSLQEIERFIHWFGNQKQAAHRVFIAGNHDRSFDKKFSDEETQIKLAEIGIEYGVYNQWCEDSEIVYLQNTSVELMGVKIWGSPITPWFHGDRWAFNKRRGPEIDEIWKKIPIKTDVLVTHGPPRYKCDKLFRDPRTHNDPDDAEIMDGYAGCDRLAHHVKNTVPFIHLFGHIHEGYGYESDRDTHYFNGSNCNLMYQVVNQPWIIEVDFKERELSIIT